MSFTERALEHAVEHVGVKTLPVLPTSPAVWLEMLLELYRPKVVDKDGVWRGKRSRRGLIGKKEFLRLLEFAVLR